MANSSNRIEVPPRGTRGTRMPGGRWLMRLAKPLIDRQVSRYRRAAAGPTAPRMAGLPVLPLTTVGARRGLGHQELRGPAAGVDGPQGGEARGGGAAQRRR